MHISLQNWHRHSRERDLYSLLARRACFTQVPVRHDDGHVRALHGEAYEARAVRQEPNGGIRRDGQEQRRRCLGGRIWICNALRWHLLPVHRSKL